MAYVVSDEVDGMLRQMIADQGGDQDNADLVREIMTTALKLLHDDADRGDLKITNTALKEIRHAFRVFQAYRDVRKVTIFGSARVEPGAPSYDLALEFAEKIVKRGFMTITGAGPGIMEAGNAGAGRDNTFGLGIRLPFEQSVNSVIAGDHKTINFKYFFTRKLIFVKETDALVLFPGGFGTMDECFETLTLIQTGKSKPMPILCLDVPGETYWPAWLDFIRDQLVGGGRISPEDLDLFQLLDSVDEACDLISRFYRNYHSMRFVSGQLVLRVQRFPSRELIDDLNSKYSDILDGGTFEVAKALPEERRNEPELNDFPRIVCAFNRHAHGRLRAMIDRINADG
jgi:uncharacterized protein (TIGR00730 family)